jgi:hypothetical protein
MLEPKKIETLTPKANYGVPVFKVTDSGLEEEGRVVIQFCKGNKADATVKRQSGFFTETLLAVCKQYLEDNNTGDLENPHTTAAIVSITNALEKLAERAKDRQDRGVQGTYQK